MIPIVTAEETAAIDAEASEPVEVLIGRAGWAVARRALTMMGGAYGRRVNLVAGKGNNGNDGRVAAAQLRRRGALVREFDPASCPAVLPPSDMVIDAAFGTGFRGTWDAPDGGDGPVLAVDIPSGVESTTGEVTGTVLDADVTVTFQAVKPGMLAGRGALACGEIEVADIGLDASRARAWLVESGDVADWWPVRAVDAHKWKSAVRVVGGSEGMPGAGRLCAAAAARAGAGLVSASALGVPLDARAEIVSPRLPADGWSGVLLEDLGRFGALALGPGLGRQDDTVEEARRAIAGAPVPVVVDGDGLHALATGGAGDVLDRRSAATVLTPHDGEYEALMDERPGSDRFAAVRRAAAGLGCVVLLKGPTTLVADPDGEVLAVDHGDERLATAGTGDVLTGVIAAGLAAGADPLTAAASAAWIHAEAGRRAGSIGVLAGDVVDHVPAALAARWDLGR